jgi:alanyl-tRNA synthetase/REP element-mobilizing transposase RayT
MLGNWSFGDYFKREAIDWAWELVVTIWKFPPQRLYATVYNPDKAKNDPSEFDQEAWNFWAEKFRSVGLDPAVHIVNGNKKDNFWMMGETGPCGPCSELHVDLTPNGDTRGSLVNKGDARCIEIWNLVFIQFNANPDGTFSPLPAKHVDTGMGFERVTSIIQGTKNFSNFANAKISNYETDIFRPIFDELEKLSGKKYGSTLPPSDLSTINSQQSTDIAFRVIADHIRTLGFAIADGIQPGNTDRNYVLRRILRRAVRYGRTLGFHEPFFYKLVDVLADTMGDVFPEIRARKQQVQETIRTEEEAFNKTLDRGIELFNEETSKYLESAGATGSARGSRADEVGSTEQLVEKTTGLAEGAKYSKRNLPHFEKPWAIYAIHFTTRERKNLSLQARKIVMDCILHWRNRRYELFAACVMPDHVHFIIQPGIKERDQNGDPVFYSLTEILHTIKSFTAHEINKLEQREGPVWEKESFDRFMRSDRDLQEKFHYICRNPWAAGIAQPNEAYPFIWTPEIQPNADAANCSVEPTSSAREPRALPDESRARLDISGDFAFKLYDTYGFPLDLTELMARERGLTVDKDGFEKLMEEQRARARAAQKKEVISLSQIETTAPTKFTGFEKLESPARVLEVVSVKDKTAVVLDTSPFYAEMGGQVGDTGEISGGGNLWRISNTQKSGNTFLHFIEGGARPSRSQFGASRDEPSVGGTPTDAGETPALPIPGNVVTLSVDVNRRNAIQRHHTVTHLLHWALHEVASKEASQKGSFVGPDKLTFDFNSAPLTPQQIADIEKLVNERILENTGVSWTEVAHADVKNRKDVMQFFGDKYGDTVRVVQIGGDANKLNGYSMELCGGTHTRATGEIGLFRIVSEAAVAAGVRRIEAVAGLDAYGLANEQLQLIKSIAGKINSPVGELEKKIETLLAHQKELEKQLKSAQQREAAGSAKDLLVKVETINGVPTIIANLGAADGDTLQTIADALKSQFKGVIVLGGAMNGAVALVANVSPDFTAKIQAGKIIQTIAPIVGGKGGGKPDNARGGGKDAAKLDEALAKAKSLMGS